MNLFNFQYCRAYETFEKSTAMFMFVCNVHITALILITFVYVRSLTNKLNTIKIHWNSDACEHAMWLRVRKEDRIVFNLKFTNHNKY